MNVSPTFPHLEPTLNSASGLATAKSAAATLFAGGAIAMVSGEPTPILVGDLRWLDGSGLLIFTAFGELPTDAHFLAFDEAIANEHGALTFWCGGLVVGELQGIEEADVEDADDYRVAWTLWQEIAPMQRPLIERCYAAIRQIR